MRSDREKDHIHYHVVAGDDQAREREKEKKSLSPRFVFSKSTQLAVCCSFTEQEEDLSQ